MLFPCSPDSLRVNTTRGITRELCGNDQFQDSHLYNGGRGITLENRSACLEFCTDESGIVRGT